MSTITTNHLRLQYGERVIAEDLTIAFDKPEIVSIIGPNGSGKSTLLKSLARLLVPTGGAVYLDGQDLKDVSMDKIARTISMLPQSASAPGDMTVRDLVTYGRLPYQGLFSKLNDLDIAAINSALKATEMEPLQHSRLSALSGGERQRLSIARAFLKDAPVILLDESTASIDPENETKIQEAIGKLIKDKTVLIIAHKLRSIVECDKIVVLKEGHLVEEGTHNELLRQAGLYHRLYSLQNESMDWTVKAQI